MFVFTYILENLNIPFLKPIAGFNPSFAFLNGLITKYQWIKPLMLASQMLMLLV